MNNIVMITGGTGSFGQAATEYLINNKAIYNNLDKIVIYSRDEHKQEKMYERFKPYDTEQKLRYIIGDVRNKERLKSAMRWVTHILHAAALKIVPSGEYNPTEYIDTNITGTKNVLECALVDPDLRMITISTDKAVLPVNLYGATKMAAEKLTLAYNNIHGEYGGQFAVVRYGNVANSNGSVIPKFIDLHRQKLPFTITDPEMTRYWIKLSDAVEFTIGELIRPDFKKGEVLIPEMASFKITDLCEAISGKKTFSSRYIGIRPGEKVHETLDGERYSNNNDNWLSVGQLRHELICMGYNIGLARYGRSTPGLRAKA